MSNSSVVYLFDPSKRTNITSSADPLILALPPVFAMFLTIFYYIRYNVNT